MSAPFVVVVFHSRSTFELYGPFDEDEADALAKRLRSSYDLRAEARLLRGWTEQAERLASAFEFRE